MNLAPTASTSALLALGDALAMVVLQERPFGREEYALFHPAGQLGRKLMKVREVMRKGEHLPIAKSGSKLREVVLVMNSHPGRAGAALIVDAQSRLVGIFHPRRSLAPPGEGRARHEPAGRRVDGEDAQGDRPDALVEEAMHICASTASTRFRSSMPSAGRSG
jgi:arabinose-5-phosphate isomerase